MQEMNACTTKAILWSFSSRRPGLKSTITLAPANRTIYMIIVTLLHPRRKKIADLRQAQGGFRATLSSAAAQNLHKIAATRGTKNLIDCSVGDSSPFARSATKSSRLSTTQNAQTQKQIWAASI